MEGISRLSRKPRFFSQDHHRRGGGMANLLVIPQTGFSLDVLLSFPLVASRDERAGPHQG